MIKLATKKDLKHYHEAYIYIDLFIVKFCKKSNAFIVEDKYGSIFQQGLPFDSQWKEFKNKFVLKREKQAQKLAKLLNKNKSLKNFSIATSKNKLI